MVAAAPRPWSQPRRVSIIQSLTRGGPAVGGRSAFDVRYPPDLQVGASYQEIHQ